MTVRERTPVLTEAGARRLTARIRDALALADDLLAQAYAGEAWGALGHASWEAYCAAELPELRLLKLRSGPRRARVAKLLEQGATERDIAAATGSSPATAHRDVLAVTGRAAGPASFEAESAAAPLPRWAEVARHVAAQGARGLTCRELEHETGWGHGVASAACHAAERKGRIARVARFRQGYAAYVAV